MNIPTNQEKQPSLDPSLLHAKEFEDLILAEYSHSHAPVDELQKARVWRRIEQKTTAAATRKRTWGYGSAFSLVAVVLIAVSSAFLQEKDPLTRVKSGTDYSLTLKALQHQKGQPPQKFANQVAKVGDIAIFEIQSSKQIFFSLIMQVGQQHPQVLVGPQQSKEGPAYPLTKKNHIFGYEVEPHQKHIRFCLLSATTKQALEKQLRLLGPNKFLDNNTCVSLKMEPK